MSYRSKKTFVAASGNGNASQNKQPTSIADSSLETSQALKHSTPATSQPPKPPSFVTTQPPKPSCPTTSQPATSPFNPSASKWGPFNPPTTRASQTFGYIAEPIKPSLAARNMTKFTLTPSLKPTQPSMPELASSLQKPHIRTTSSQSNLSQPTLDTPQQSTVYTTTEASLQQQGKVTETMSMPSKQKLKSAASQQQRISMGRQYNLEATSAPQQQQRRSSISSQQKKSELPHQKEMQQPSHKRTPAMSPDIGTKPSLEKRVAAASMGATKPQMSRTPPTLETMTSDENRIEKDVNNESIQPCQGKVPNPYMHVTGDTQHMEQSSPDIHVESELRQNQSMVEASSDSEDLNEVENADPSVNKGKSSKPRRRNRTIVPNWPEKVNFDENDGVLAYDANGQGYLVKGPTQPRDVWYDNEFRYLVKFNEYKQPLGKGGSILVRFLGDVAKRESFCPVGYKRWHMLKKTMKADIVTIVRKHFLIPGGELYDKAILKRTSKSWKRYRYFLRETYFNPETRSINQIVNNPPDGVNKQNWTDLVDYWLSDDFEKLSKKGKEARASLAHTHFSGATSFANRRVDLEKKKGTFSELDFYKEVYTKKDGSFKEGSLSSQFLEEANVKVKENLGSSSKSKVEVENEIFNELMYKDEVPKRPLNYGFGVKQSDIFGVQSILRKEKSTYVNHGTVEVENLKAALSAVKKQNEDLQQKNDVLETKFNETTHIFNETTHTFKAVAAQLEQVLKAVRNGNVSSQLVDAAEAAIFVVNSQIPNVSSSNDGKK